MSQKEAVFMFNSYFISNFCVEEHLPVINCRAVLFDVHTKITDQEKQLGDLDAKFLLTSPSFDEPYVFKKQFVNLPLNDGIVWAFDEAVEDLETQEFQDLVSAVFDAQIYFYACKGTIFAGLDLIKLVASPLVMEG